MELRHLRYFLAVAEELHFGRAAKRLNVSQPPLSQQILQLEEEIGVKLFERNKRLVRLTSAGKVFATESRLILAQVDHAAMVAEWASQGQIGQLTIGTVTSVNSIMHKTCVKILQTYTKRHPHVRLTLRSLHSPQQIEALHTGRLDAGFLTASLAHDPLLTAEVVQRDRLMLALPRGNRLSKRQSVSMHALAAEPFIVVSRQLAPAFHDLVVMWFRDHGYSANTAYEADSFFSILTLVACGVGVALLPASLHGVRSDVIFKEVEVKTPSIEFMVAYRRDSQSELLQNFLAVAREVVGS